MSENILKFTFLAVMIAVILIGQQLSGAKSEPLVHTDIQAQTPYALTSAVTGESLGTAPGTAMGEPRVLAESAPQVKTAEAAALNSREAVAVFRRFRFDPPPNSMAAAAILMDFATGEVYYELAPGKRWPIASITKLVTAVVALRNLDGALPVTIARSDIVAYDPETKIKEGDSFRVRDLLRLLLIVSNNEAAEALARTYGRENFLNAMNATAKEWGFMSTHFSDPTGLSFANQSTPAELWELSRRIYAERPDIFQITRSKIMNVTELNSQKIIELKNINLFAGRADFLGGKTGHTQEAGDNLLTIFSHEGRPVFVAVLGAEDRFAETDKLINWFKINFTAKR